MTSVYAEVIGDPIAHSKSPLIHNFWLNKLGIDADYRATRVTAGELPAYLATRRVDPDWRGCNVTMPLKEAVLPLLDTIQRGAAAIGAVNTVRRDADGRLHGRSTDPHGIWRALDHRGPFARAVVIGAGGAARSAAFALRRLEIERLHIMARHEAKATALARDLFPGATADSLGPPPACDLLINATPLGMSGHPWPGLSLANLPPTACVFDMVYVPARTALLIDAEARGFATVGGAKMLLHQAAEAFATFFDCAVPQDSFVELEELLA